MEYSTLATFSWNDCLRYFGGEETSALASLVKFRSELIHCINS
jgi:hypothetical protein